MNEYMRQIHDFDPDETHDWLESLDAVVEERGPERAHFLLSKLLQHMHVEKMPLPALIQTPYVNTIPPSKEPGYPGDEHIEKRIRRYIRWNAVAMVVKANRKYAGIGGHLSTYASAATLYEVGFNHFFRGPDDGFGDQLFIQGHASPGIYARAFLEGRITEEQMNHFRREVGRKGLPSYPHPWLMPGFWEFPTVSMGLGPINAIYQARFNRYLQARGIANTEGSRVWAFLGDGETDEPEALGALHVAARERLDNLVFVVNCNLQRLDGPVRGNGKIIQELETNFNGAGWRVIKVVWGRHWDPLLAADQDGLLVRKMTETVDGEYQKFSVEDGHYVRRNFFGPDARLRAMVEHLSDSDLQRLRRGGHDFRKVYAAYDAAVQESDRPTVILAKTVKGWSLGEGIQARNATHQQKKMTLKELAIFRDLLGLDVSDHELLDPPFVRFSKDSDEYKYLVERRHALDGFVPERRALVTVVDHKAPTLPYFERYLRGSGEQEVSTTAAFSRMLAQLLNHKELGPHVVPIIPDEARTFGLDALFNKYGIYSAVGQLYEPVDADMLMSYREAKDGQVLEEGINEAGSLASFIAAGSSYSSFDRPMLPFYIFYSMFGFQRTGDQIWASGDQRCRGFMVGATAGRTTLTGEGLQHCDGNSHLFSTVYPHVVSYDPAFAYEIAVIVQHGLERIWDRQEDVVFYMTVENEPYVMPNMPEGDDVQQGIIDGMYLYKRGESDGPRVQLLGSGPILREALRAQGLLAEHFGVAADVWSVTSYTELRRQALACDRLATFEPDRPRQTPLVTRLLQEAEGPVIAATDYVTLVPDQIARWVPGGLVSLGTDGFGRSHTRPALRRFFENDAESIALTALRRLADTGAIDAERLVGAFELLDVDLRKPDPATFMP